MNIKCVQFDVGEEFSYCWVYPEILPFGLHICSFMIRTWQKLRKALSGLEGSWVKLEKT